MNLKMKLSKKLQNKMKQGITYILDVWRKGTHEKKKRIITGIAICVAGGGLIFGTVLTVRNCSVRRAVAEAEELHNTARGAIARAIHASDGVADGIERLYIITTDARLTNERAASELVKTEKGTQRLQAVIRELRALIAEIEEENKIR